MAIDLSRWASSLRDFEEFLNNENYSAAENWARRLKSSQIDKVEGAVAEAVAWDFTDHRCDSSHLADKPGTGGVDFEFCIGDYRFLMEVTTIFLICGFGFCPETPPVFGAINPEAEIPFDPTVLSDIPFCSFRDWPVTTEIDFDWTISKQDEDEQELRAREQRLRVSGLGPLVDGIRQEIHRRSSYSDDDLV